MRPFSSCVCPLVSEQVGSENIPRLLSNLSVLNGRPSMLACWLPTDRMRQGVYQDPVKHRTAAPGCYLEKPTAVRCGACFETDDQRLNIQRLLLCVSCPVLYIQPFFLATDVEHEHAQRPRRFPPYRNSSTSYSSTWTENTTLSYLAHST